jgi:hypothetical protein
MINGYRNRVFDGPGSGFSLSEVWPSFFEHPSGSRERGREEYKKKGADAILGRDSRPAALRFVSFQLLTDHILHPTSHLVLHSSIVEETLSHG